MHDSMWGTMLLIRSDFRRSAQHYGVRLTVRRALGMLMLPPILALVLYRWSHYWHRKGVKLLSWPLYIFNVILTGCDISPRTEIGERCFLGHANGHLIAGRIGRNATLIARSAVGSRTSLVDIGGGPGLPVLEDNVTVGCGAQIHGCVRVGEGARIGAMTLVLEDVPPGVTIVGNPAKIVRRPPRDDTTEIPDERSFTEAGSEWEQA